MKVTMVQKSRLAYLYVGMTVLLWASTSAIGKLLVTDLDNLQVSFFIFLIASITLFCIALLQGKLHLIKEYSPKDYLTFCWMGFIGIFLYYVFYFRALMYLPAQEATIVNYLWPIMVVIFSMIILKEDLTLRKIVAILISFVGIIVVVTQGEILSPQFANAKGIFFALGAAVTWGLFSTIGKKHDYERVTSMMFYYLFAFLFIALTVSLFSSFPALSLLQLVCLLWLGIFTSGVAFVLWFLALKYGDTAKISSIIYLSPFISMVYIHLLVGEEILLSSILGLVIVIAGIIVQASRKNS